MFHGCPLLTPIKNSRRRSWQILSNPSQHSCTSERKTHKLLDPIWESQNHHSLGHHRQIQLSDVFNQNHPTCAVHLHSQIQPGLGCGSLSWMFSLALAHSLTCLSIRDCLFERVLRWIALHVLLFKPPLGCPIRQHQLQYPPNFRSSPRSGLKSGSLVHFSLALRATTLSKVVWHSIRFSTFRRAFTNWSNESSLTLVVTRKLLGCIPVIFNFLGNLFSRAQTELIQHQMLSHVLWCNFVHVNCPSDTITYAFTRSCRVLLSIFVPLSTIDSWVW